jgi:tetratricopeptide (TPR) repeat protein
MEGAARTAVALASRASDSVLKLRAHHRLACALCMLGELDRGKSLATDGLASARAQDSAAMVGHFLNALCFVASRQDDLLTGLRLAQQELAIERELGDPVAEADTLINVGDFYVDLGANVEAASYLDQGLRLSRAVGSRAKEPYALCGLCLLALRQHDNEQAVALANAALNIAISVQDRRGEIIAQCLLGDAELASLRHEAAARDFRQHALADGVRDAQSGYEAAAGLARVALARRVRPASSSPRISFVYRRWGGKLVGREAHAIRLTCYEVLACAEDARAGEVLAAAHAALRIIAESISDMELRSSYLDKIPSIVRLLPRGRHAAVPAARLSTRVVSATRPNKEPR